MSRFDSLDDEARRFVEFNTHDVAGPSSLAVETFGPLSAYLPVAANDNRRGDFMQVWRGAKYWPLDPQPDEVDIDDIANSLGKQCRYAGHCLKFYSVAEHSVLIARWLLPRFGAQVAMWGLLHDAPETYLVDVPRPVKPELGGYKTIEQANMLAVCLRFGLPLEMPAAVKEADDRIIGDEIVNMRPMDWHAKHDDPLGVKLMLWGPDVAPLWFLNEYRKLAGMLGLGMGAAA